MDALFQTQTHFLCVTGKIAQVFLWIGSIGIERLVKHFIVHLSAVFETVANGTLPIINGKLYIIEIPACSAKFKQSRLYKIYFCRKRVNFQFCP